MQFADAAAQEKHRRRMASSFGPFKRLLGYVWPQKRYLYPAIGCILLMAVTYSVSLGSIPFVLSVLMLPQGLHGWVAQTAAEERLKCEFGVYDSLKDDPVEGLEQGTTTLRDFKSSSPLGSAGLKRGAFIVAVNGVSGQAAQIFPLMASQESKLRLRYRLSSDEPGVEHEAEIEVEPTELQYQLLQQAVSHIPGGLTPGERWKTLLVVLGLMMLVILTGNIARFWAEYLTVLVNCRAIVDVRRQMYAHILRLPLSHFSRNTTDTMNRIQVDTNDIFRGLSNFFEKIVTEPFKAIGVACIALYMDWKLTVAVMVTTPVAVLLIRSIGKKIRRANKKVLATYARMLGALESTLTGMRVVKGYGRENYERKRLFRIDRTVLRHQLKMGRTEALASPFLEMLAFLAVAGAVMYFAREMLSGGQEMPHFLGMIVLLVAILDPIRKLTTVYPKIQRANAACERVFEIIDSPSEYQQDADKPCIRPLERTIEFAGVTFVYPETTRPALRDVSLTVHRGETIALVGANGSGKTTLVSLLPRFFPVTGGRILIDDQDVSEVSLRSLRGQFSLITQDTVIFPDSVRSNIAYGRLDASRDEIEAAAKKAFADEFIRQMPDGYDTIVGEHGATLSGGQKQRIAIARAILRDAPILIFDEATGQVDPESEMKILQALEEFLQDRTAFIIAHRNSTVSQADRIVVMEDGQIAAIGTHEELLQSCLLYQRLYETQFRTGEASPQTPSLAPAAADTDDEDS